MMEHPCGHNDEWVGYVSQEQCTLQKMHMEASGASRICRGIEIRLLYRLSALPFLTQTKEENMNLMKGRHRPCAKM